MEKKKYWQDIFWQASGNTAAQVLGIAAMPLLTRLYSPEQFATLNIFIQIVAVLSILLTLRLEYLVMLPQSHKEAGGLVFLLSVMGVILAIPHGLILYGVGEQRIAALLGDPEIDRWLPLALATGWLVSMSVAVQQLVMRLEGFRASGISEIFGRVGYLVSALIGSLASGLTGLMGAMAVGGIAKILSLIRFFRRKGFEFCFRSGWRAAISLRKAAASMSIANLVSTFAALIPIAFIGREYDKSAMGCFGLVITTLYLPSVLIGQAIGSVYYQRASAAFISGDSIRPIFVHTLTQLLMISVPLYILIGVLAPLAYPLIFGEAWKLSGDMAPILSVAACVSLVSTPLERTCLVAGFWWYPIAWHSLRAISTVLAVMAASFYGFDLRGFILILSAQMAIMYLIDLCSNYMFSKSVRK